MTHRCNPPDCLTCEEIAEERSRPVEGRDDWRIGQSRYERELDGRWG